MGYMGYIDYTNHATRDARAWVANAEGLFEENYNLALTQQVYNPSK